PDDAAAMALLGELELSARNLSEAEKWLREAEKRQPFDRIVLVHLASCLEQAAKPIEAEAIRTRMKQVEADLDESGSLFKAIAQSPGDPEPRTQLAIRLMRNGQEPEAIRWLESSLRLDPNHADSFKTLAECYSRLGDPNKAKVYQDREKELRRQKK